MPPPIDPGMHDKNSNPSISFSIANSDNFLSKHELPAIIVLSFSFDRLLKLLPSLITAPSKRLSSNNN